MHGIGLLDDENELSMSMSMSMSNDSMFLFLIDNNQMRECFCSSRIFYMAI